MRRGEGKERKKGEERKDEKRRDEKRGGDGRVRVRGKRFKTSAISMIPRANLSVQQQQALE
jgi:hypothetical protein